MTDLEAVELCAVGQIILINDIYNYVSRQVSYNFKFQHNRRRQSNHFKYYIVAQPTMAYERGQHNMLYFDLLDKFSLNCLQNTI